MERQRESEQERRLLYLRVLLKGMIAVAFMAVVFVFFSVFLSDDGEEGTLQGERFVIGDMTPGETRTLTWDGRPVLIHRRTAEQIAVLEQTDAMQRSQLRDPDSERSEQPDDMMGPLRSQSPDWFIAIGLGTDYGCPLGWLAADQEPFAGLPWPGGFIDSCRESRYDLAGRVYARQYADRNLIVPDYTLVGDTVILGGR